MAKDAQQDSQKLSKHAFGMIVVLIIEYFLGMSANLFVQFPEGEHEKQLWAFAWQQLPVVLHIIVGVLLLIGTVVLVIRALKQHNRPWIIAASIAAGATLAAIVAGSLFIPTQTDWYSFIMALSFIIALLSYFWGIYTTK